MYRQREAHSRPQPKMRGTSNRHRGDRMPRSPFLRILRASGLGIFAGSAVSALILLIGAFAVSQTEDPGMLLQPIAILSLGFSSVICGFVTVRSATGTSFPVYAVSACLWILLCTLFSMLLPSGVGGFSSVYSALLRLLQVLFVLLGAFIGKNRPRSVNRRGRKR